MQKHRNQQRKAHTQRHAMKPGPHELAQQHPKKRCQHESRNAPNEALPPRSGRQNNKSVGTDFRYAVEFSKYGRAPLEVSRPPPGQPDLRYRLSAVIPNRRFLPIPTPLSRRKPGHLRLTGGSLSGLAPGHPAARILIAIRLLCGSPWAKTKLRADVL